MLSSDKNVESIAQLVESLKNYVGLQGEYLKFNAVEKVVRLTTALTLAIIFIIIGEAILFYLSFALIYAMEPLTGMALAFLIMALLFLLLLVIVFIKRKSWIERPLVRFLSDILLN